MATDEAREEALEGYEILVRAALEAAIELEPLEGELHVDHDRRYKLIEDAAGPSIARLVHDIVEHAEELLRTELEPKTWMQHLSNQGDMVYISLHDSRDTKHVPVGGDTPRGYVPVWIQMAVKPQRVHVK